MAITPVQSKDLPPKQPIGHSADGEVNETPEPDSGQSSERSANEGSSRDAAAEEGNSEARPSGSAGGKPAKSNEDEERGESNASAEEAAHPAAKKPARIADPEPAVTPPAAERASAPAAAPAAAAPKATPAAASESSPAPVKPAAPQKAEAPKAAGSGHVEPTVPTGNDVFSERAKEVLEAESNIKQSAKVHPLALRYPDHDVIVCTAGCGPGGRVIYKERKDRRRGVGQAQMIPTSAQAGSAPSTAAASNALTCIAGCFTTPKSYRAVEKRADLVTLPAANETTPPAAEQPAPEAQAPQAGVGATADMLSGKWTTSVKAGEAEADGPKDTSQPDMQKMKNRAMGSGDWMKKINADKTEPPAMPN
jgi:hypothetical protein